VVWVAVLTQRAPPHRRAPFRGHSPRGRTTWQHVAPAGVLLRAVPPGGLTPAGWHRPTCTALAQGRKAVPSPSGAVASAGVPSSGPAMRCAASLGRDICGDERAEARQASCRARPGSQSYRQVGRDPLW